jgi:hypothetical protein
VGKYYHQTLWKLDGKELFSSRKALEEYITDNWEEYAYPIGDEKNFVALQENKFGGIDIVYETMDYDVETGHPTAWLRQTESVEVETVELTHLVEEL